MKKLFYAAAAALVMFAASCGKSDEKSAEFFSAQATDSLLISFGQVAGSALNQQITDAMRGDSTLTKEAFMKGLQYAMACDTSEAYMNGIIVGMQIQRQLTTFSRMGLDVDSRLVLDNFKQAFMADTVPSQMDMTMLDSRYRQWNDSLTAAKRNYEKAQLEKAPEAIENTQKGEAFIKEAMAKDPEIKVTPSGLAYKIENPGEGEKIDPTKRVVLTYTSKTPDGNVVEQYNAAPVMLASRTAALKEGVSMLAKGGKATFYAPGKLAFGVEPPAHYNVGPNQMLIYEVEVIGLPEAPEGMLR